MGPQSKSQGESSRAGAGIPDFYFHLQTLTTGLGGDKKVSLGWPELRGQDRHVLEVRPDLAKSWGAARPFQDTPRPLLNETEWKLRWAGVVHGGQDCPLCGLGLAEEANYPGAPAPQGLITRSSSHHLQAQADPPLSAPLAPACLSLLHLRRPGHLFGICGDCGPNIIGVETPTRTPEG